MVPVAAMRQRMGISRAQASAKPSAEASMPPPSTTSDGASLAARRRIGVGRTLPLDKVVIRLRVSITVLAVSRRDRLHPTVLGNPIQLNL